MFGICLSYPGYLHAQSGHDKLSNLSLIPNVVLYLMEYCVSEAGDDYGDGDRGEGSDDGVKEGGNEENEGNEGNEENEGNASNSTGSTNMERSHEDATATTAVPARQTARTIAKTMIAECVIAKHLYGPKKVPEHIINSLTEWHKAYPKAKPPCIHQGIPCPRWPWKVFDQNGKQLLFSMFRVQEPIPYYFTFVIDHHGASKLVATEEFSRKQCLLFGWDFRTGFESEPCAVWLIKRNVEDIVFRKGYFKNFRKGSNGKTKSPDSIAAGNGPSTTTDQNTARADRARRRSERFSRVRGGESTNATTSSTQRRDNNPDGDAGSDPVYSPSESESEEVRTVPTKRRRKNSSVAPPASPTPPPPYLASTALPETPAPVPSQAPALAPEPPTLPAPPTSTPTSTNLNKVASALISSDVVCHLPTDECISSSYLFERAREFLCTLGQELAAKFLVCQVPSEGIRRMLYEGDETSFKWLLNDVKSLQRAAGELLIVEVKHPDWWISSTPS